MAPDRSSASEASEPGYRPPLDGVLVADFSRILAGPLCTMVLADLGATVIKVERPGTGDDTRQWGPPFAGDGTSAYYASVNRNKRSVELDLKTPDGHRRAMELACRADVLIENFRVGVMERLGLGYQAVSGKNPALIYCQISAFGTEAGAELPGYDFLVQAASGLMSVTGAPDGEPTKAGTAIVDIVAGLYAAIGILAALQERAVSGRGQRIHIDLMSSALATLVNHASSYLVGGDVPVAVGNRHPSISPYETIRTATGTVAVAAGNDDQFARLCGVLDLPTLTVDPRTATNQVRVANRDFLIERIEAVTTTMSATALMEKLRTEAIPCSMVHSIPEAFAFARAVGLDPVVTVGSGSDALDTVANPIGLSRTPVRYDLAPPDLGSSNDDVIAWLDDTQHPHGDPATSPDPAVVGADGSSAEPFSRPDGPG